ncbi:acyl-CoA dehydrogenase, partial [Gordonia araii NBRC 100433]
MSQTHEVLNQVPPLDDHDATAHQTLLEGVSREGAGWAM